ncbi:hypothetical protein F5Y09DRAFT_95751 [Xylaria sp. FL1042]|nr:hypothetical protein F5Y09DRAFT_95751 [Xylaria sp. FL1042]
MVVVVVVVVVEWRGWALVGVGVGVGVGDVHARRGARLGLRFGRDGEKKKGRLGISQDGHSSIQRNNLGPSKPPTARPRCNNISTRTSLV